MLLVAFAGGEEHVVTDNPPVESAPTSVSIDYTSREDINALSGPDIASAISSGKITHLTMINDNKFAEAINSDNTLIIHENVFNEVGRRARQDISFLNDNQKVKASWFEQFGITDTGVVLGAYEGKLMTTTGKEAQQFNPHELKEYLAKHSLDARVLPSGKLVIGEGEGMQVVPLRDTPSPNQLPRIRIENDKIMVTDGIIKIDPEHIPPGLDIIIPSGHQLHIGSWSLTSAQKMEMTTTAGNGFTVQGNSVIVSPWEKRQFIFSGGLEQRGGIVTGRTFLLPESRYQDYELEETDHKKKEFILLYTATVSQRTQILTTDCLGRVNCLTRTEVQPHVARYLSPWQPNRIILSAREGNQIQLTLSRGMEFIEVRPITDDSIITVTQDGQGVTIGKEGRVSPLGASDLRQLPEIKSFKDENEFTLVKAGRISTCTATVCQEIASARGAGRRGNIVHIGVARLGGQRASLETARQNNLQLTGYEALNLPFENVQADLRQAQTIVISGHHYEAQTRVWGERGELDLRDLPSSDATQAVAFSACNTIKDPADKVITTLQEKYPNLKVIFGYNTKAPLYDSTVWEKSLPIIQRTLEDGNPEPLKRYVVQEGVVGRGEQGPQKLGVYVKENQEWRFCAPGGCHVVEPAVAAVSSESTERRN